MNPLTIGKGKLTKIGVGVAAAGPLLANVVALLQGREWQDLVSAAEGTLASGSVLCGAVLALWGAFRAAIGYGGR